MIGVGWVTTMGYWLETAGSIGAIIAFTIGGILMLFIGFCYAEVTSILPVAGGEVAYAYKSFGVGKSFIVGWFLSFGYLSVSAFEAVSVGKVLSYLIPGIDIWPLYEISGEKVYLTHLVIALIFTFLITYINFRGMQGSAKLQTWLTFVFLGCVLVFITAAFISGDFKNLSPAFTYSKTSNMAGILAVLVTVPFWFVGFDTIPQSAEEADTSISHRKLGILIVASIVSAVAFYIFLILGTSMLGNREALFNADLPTAEAFKLALNSDWLVNLILFSALIGLITSWNGFFLAGSRVLFALGRGRIISPGIGKAHWKYQTPANAVLFSGIITLLASFLGRGAMLAFVNVGSFCIALAFLGVSLSYIKLKKIYKVKRPFKAPGNYVTGYIAFLGSLMILLVMIIPNSPAAISWPLEWGILLTLSLLGMVFWIFSKNMRMKTPPEQRDYLILEQLETDPETENKPYKSI